MSCLGFEIHDDGVDGLWDVVASTSEKLQDEVVVFHQRREIVVVVEENVSYLLYEI